VVAPPSSGYGIPSMRGITPLGGHELLLLVQFGLLLLAARALGDGTRGAHPHR
jgi:hypothetical protein